MQASSYKKFSKFLHKAILTYPRKNLQCIFQPRASHPFLKLILNMVSILASFTTILFLNYLHL
jgi:hypothetical protein